MKVRFRIFGEHGQEFEGNVRDTYPWPTLLVKLPDGRLGLAANRSPNDDDIPIMVVDPIELVEVTTVAKAPTKRPEPDEWNVADIPFGAY